MYPSDGYNLNHKGKNETYDDFNRTLYSFVENGKKVLDVGCPTGRLMEKLKTEKECYLVGIEINEEMARIAQKRCDKLIFADIESLHDLPFPSQFFDIIIFGDILEHTRNPSEILNLLSEYLSGDGYILVSIPNMAFITVRLNLLLGKFNYTRHGILDKTHLRFFTFKTAKELIENCGYKIKSVDIHQPVRKRYYYFLKFLGKVWKSLFAIDFVFKATKTDGHSQNYNVRKEKADPNIF